MKKIKHYITLLCLVFYIPTLGAIERNHALDFNWKFTLGDNSKFKDPNFNDSQWRLLNLPHDWSIEGEYNENNPSAGFGAWLPTGIGWYRKNLTIDPEWQGKKLILRFDGIYLNSDVWINGKHLGHRPNGYISFSYDITPHLNSGKNANKTNVIAVRVDHQLAPTGRWYTGSGIYRHVWLDVVNPVYVPNDGIFIKTDSINLAQQTAQLSVQTEVKGLTNESRFTIKHTLLNKQGKAVASTAQKLTQSNSTTPINANLIVNNAQYWSTENPYLYQLKTNIFADNELIDEKITQVGIRSIAYNVKQGFLLNEQPIELQGMCLHHDGGPVGSAVPDDIWRFRLQQMKKMGINALRPAHTPFAPIFYDLADEMGFMIMDEVFDGWETEKAQFDYGLHFEDWWQKDLSAFIKRDRNHPSVVMWSIGNEVTNATAETQKTLVDFIKTLDDSRPVTQGRGYMLGHLDIDGFNGHGEYKNYLAEHFEQHPNTTQIGTEITHTLSTRGIYRTKTWYRDKVLNPWKWEQIKDKVNYIDDFTQEEVFKGEHELYSSSYDNAFVRMNIRDEIKMAKALPYLLGTFRWTAYDYLGESKTWPARTRNFGVIDLASFEKDPYYLYQSQWTKAPMVHLLPHWTHPGKEGVTIPVVVYTNLAQAELFLNGRSLGVKKMTDEMQIVWMVPYQAGELKVVASSGSVIRTKTVNTASTAKQIALSADKTQITANQTDVVHITLDITDNMGNLVPRSDNTISFEISGPAKLLGAENGDILDLTHHKSQNRKVFNGKLRILLQATDKAGKINLTASGKGLKTSQISINSLTL